MISYQICLFYFNLCILLFLLPIKNIAYILKNAGYPILKTLTFKGVTLFHSDGDTKLQKRK